MANDILLADATGTNRNFAATDIGSGTERLAQLNEVMMYSSGITSGSISALNGAVQASAVGSGSVGFTVLAGTYNMTIAFEASFDVGTPTNWFPLLVSRLDSASALTSSAVSNSAFAWSGASDGGMTWVRMRASAYTSGTANVQISPGAGPVDPTPTVGGSLSINAANNRIGAVGASAQWFDSTTTALGISAAFTGASRDLVGAATGSQANSNYPAEYRIMSEADQAGTLYLEVSRDNVTFRRIKGAAMAAFDGTSVQYAEIIYKPITRYARPVLVNGGVAETQMMVQEMLMGNV